MLQLAWEDAAIFEIEILDKDKPFSPLIQGILSSEMSICPKQIMHATFTHVYLNLNHGESMHDRHRFKFNFLTYVNHE